MYTAVGKMLPRQAGLQVRCNFTAVEFWDVVSVYVVVVVSVVVVLVAAVVVFLPRVGLRIKEGVPSYLATSALSCTARRMSVPHMYS